MVALTNGTEVIRLVEKAIRNPDRYRRVIVSSPFLDDVGVTLTSLIDTEGRLTSAMKVASVPSLAMIDAAGDVVARHTGELEADTLDELLASL